MRWCKENIKSLLNRIPHGVLKFTNITWWVVVVLGVLIVAIGIAMPAMLALSAPSIGIIGGADGPSYWFLLGSGCYHIPAFLITIGFAVFIMGL